MVKILFYTFAGEYKRVEQKKSLVTVYTLHKRDHFIIPLKLNNPH